MPAATRRNLLQLNCGASTPAMAATMVATPTAHHINLRGHPRWSIDANDCAATSCGLPFYQRR